MIRISKEYVFIQTPNRYHPIDFHTILPIIFIGCQKKIHRRILKYMKLDFYSKEENSKSFVIKRFKKNLCKT